MRSKHGHPFANWDTPRRALDGTGPLRCESGESVKIAPAAIGWTGRIAHPDAPLGGGGPGSFRQPGPERIENDGNSPFAGNQGPLQAAPMQAGQTPTPPNPPPITRPRSLGSLKTLQNEFADVAIDAKIVADGSDPNGSATTDFIIPVSKSPGYSDSGGKISSFDGKFTWKGTITIQTVYGPDFGATDVACYGRGTTADDVKNRDITLGFHENCHQVDFENFLSGNTLPDPPRMELGMKKSEYEAETKRFKKELDEYRRKMKAASLTATDETGHKESTWKKTGKCFLHLVP